MMSPRTRLLSVLTAAFMVLVWVTRIRNAAADDSISTATRTGAYALSAAGLVGAVLLLVFAARRSRPIWAVLVAGVHAVVWAVRGLQIALGPRPVGFKVVHVVLALVAIGLAIAVARSTRSHRSAVSLSAAP